MCLKLDLIAGNVLFVDGSNIRANTSRGQAHDQASSQEIYARRKARVEHPFGHIKRNLKTDGFLIRGQTGVNAETSLSATCFNLARMITILGVSGLIEKLIPFRTPALG